jgi:hemoglobin-like flavoprotein
MSNRFPRNNGFGKATAPALQQHGVEITTRMYQRLFVDPEIKALFDMAAHESGAQPSGSRRRSSPLRRNVTSSTC